MTIHKTTVVVSNKKMGNVVSEVNVECVAFEQDEN